MENNIIKLKIRNKFSRILRFPLIFFGHYRIARVRELSKNEALKLAFKLSIFTIRKVELTF